MPAGQTVPTKKPARMGRFFKLKPDDVLLSHGEPPHYHRRRALSLLSSKWIQVVQTRYGRQANQSTEDARPRVGGHRPRTKSIDEVSKCVQLVSLFHTIEASHAWLA